MLSAANQTNWTSGVTYQYDGNGVTCPAGATDQTSHLSLVTATGTNGATFSHSYCYNNLGELQQDTQTTAGAPYQPFTYTYNAAGFESTVTYPSGRQLTYDYDGAARPLDVKPTANPSTLYASVNQYMPQGAIGQLTLRNQLQEQTCYNALLQEVGMRIGTAGPSSNCASQGGDLLGLGFSYTLASPPPGGSATGSNLQSQTMTAPLSSGLGTLTLGQTYGYDTLNRINAVNEAVNGTANWYWNFAADQYGNLWSNGTNLSSNTTNMAQAQSYYSTATNRLTQYGSSSSPTSVPNDGYDAAGNLTDLPESAGIGVGVMQYDGDNHMVQYQANSQSANITTYDYDGEGRRVRRTETGVVALTTVYVYDGAGNLAAEYDQGGTPPAGGMQYLTQDHLGSTRLVTDGNGAPVQRLDTLRLGTRFHRRWGAEAP